MHRLNGPATATGGATPEVSVLLPYRDAAETLPEALDSILGQRGVKLEVLAVDDGSHDDSPALVQRLAARHRDLHALRTCGTQRVVAGTEGAALPDPSGAGTGVSGTRSTGIAAALTRAVAHARAPLLARMDADDVALPDRLRAQCDALAAQPALAALGTRVEPFPAAETAEGMRRYVAWQNGLLSPHEHRVQLFVESPLCHPSVVLRRQALAAVGGYRDGPFPEDYDLWLRLDAAGFALGKLPEVMLRWRQTARSATRTDPRYVRAAFAPLKAPYLAARLRARTRPLDVWGAGRTGRRLARALEAHGARASRFLDVDPLKIGRTARGARIEPLEALSPPGERWVVVALGARGARDLARTHLTERGYTEGTDFLCAS